MRRRGDDECVANAECSNTFGGYSCACGPGFAGDGAMECKGLCDVAVADGGPTCDAHGLCRVNQDRAVCDVVRRGLLGRRRHLHRRSAIARSRATATARTTWPTRSASATRARAPAPARRATAAAIPTSADVHRRRRVRHEQRRLRRRLTPDTPPTTAAPTCRAASTATARPAIQKNSDGRCVNINECARGSALCHPNADCTTTPTAATPASARTASTATATCAPTIDECAEGEDNCLKDDTRAA